VAFFIHKGCKSKHYILHAHEEKQEMLKTPADKSNKILFKYL